MYALRPVLPRFWAIRTSTWTRVCGANLAGPSAAYLRRPFHVCVALGGSNAERDGSRDGVPLDALQRTSDEGQDGSRLDRFEVEVKSGGSSRSFDVSRKGLFKLSDDYKEEATSWNDKSPLEKHLISTIQLRGPVSVSTFMKEALTNPAFGYYATQDPFGKSGDFVTSPEISQLFGEIVGVWVEQMWEQLGKPSPFRLIEMGPGKGTLMEGVLKVLNQVKALPHLNLEIHMVENSFRLQQEQARALGCTGAALADLESWQRQHKHVIDVQWNTEPDREPRELGIPIEELSGSSSPLASRDANSAVVLGVPFCLIAHEFFDALPVCQFEFRDGAWKERLVDISADQDGLGDFRFVLSPRNTPASVSLSNRSLSEQAPGVNMGDDVGATAGEEGGHPCEGSMLEVCADAEAIAQQIGYRVLEDGGVALLMDYGQDRPSANSLRAIQGHAYTNPLKNVGKSDLTADVDFRALKRAALDLEGNGDGGALSVEAAGPVSQREWLQSLGIEARLARLLKNPTFASTDDGIAPRTGKAADGPLPATAKTPREHIRDPRVRAAVEGYHRIVDDQQMGRTYKVMAILNSGVAQPLGF